MYYIVMSVFIGILLGVSVAQHSVIRNLQKRLHIRWCDFANEPKHPEDKHYVVFHVDKAKPIVTSHEDSLRINFEYTMHYDRIEEFKQNALLKRSESNEKI